MYLSRILKFLHAYWSAAERGALFQSLSGQTNFKHLSWPVFLDLGVLSAQNIDVASKPGLTVDICELDTNDCWCGPPTEPPQVDTDYESGSGSGDESIDSEIVEIVESEVENQNTLSASNLFEDDLDTDFSTLDFSVSEQSQAKIVSCSRKYEKMNFGLENLITIEGESFLNVNLAMIKAYCAVDKKCIGFMFKNSQGSLIHAISGDETFFMNRNSELNSDLYLDTEIHAKNPNLSIDEVECEISFSNIVHVQSSNTAEERLVDTVSDIFETHQIQLNQKTHSRRIRRSFDFSSLSNYGCWCSKPFTGTSLQGTPLDEVDSVCRQWSKCTRCEILTNCENSGGDGYSLVYSINGTDFECFGESECARSRCLCSGNFGLSLASHFSKGNQLNAQNSDVGSDRCHGKVSENLISSDQNRVMQMEAPSVSISNEYSEVDDTISSTNFSDENLSVEEQTSSQNVPSSLVFTSQISSSTIQEFSVPSTNLVNMEETCCGEAPTWQPYHVATHSCTNGQIVEL